MKRVPRKDRWGKLTNNKVTGWVGSRKLTWEHMCKTGHQHAANENTHKPCVHTRHDNKKAHSQWKTQAKNTNCVQQHKSTHVDRSVSGRANSRPHTLTTRRVRTPTRNWNSRHECWDPNTTLQHETRHADEQVHSSSTLEAARSHENRTWRECQGCHKTMNNTRPKWQNPDRDNRAHSCSMLPSHHIKERQNSIHCLNFLKKTEQFIWYTCAENSFSNMCTQGHSWGLRGPGAGYTSGPCLKLFN